MVSTYCKVGCLFDGRYLYTAPSGIGSKWPSERRISTGNSFSEYEIVYDDNSSQELDDDDVEHLIEEGQNEIEEESDQVYSS